MEGDDTPAGRVRRKKAGHAATPFDVSGLPVVPADVAAKIKVLAGLVSAQSPGAPRPAMPIEPRPPKPGTERWPVKTGADPDAHAVGTYDFAETGAAGIVDTTVEELIRLPRPADMLPADENHEEYQQKRARPVELIIWRVTADIIVIKKEDDGDLHIVLQGDSGDTMIAEAPTPGPPFVKPNSPWLDAVGEVRRGIAGKFGPGFAGTPFSPLGKTLVPVAAAPPGAASTSFSVAEGAEDPFGPVPPFKTKVPATPARVVGVGFFDRVHGQTGVSIGNGIELHPILDIEWV